MIAIGATLEDDCQLAHASLAVFLVVAIVLHIGVSLYFGYGLGSAG